MTRSRARTAKLRAPSPRPTCWSRKREEAEYFRTPDHVAYADVTVDGHRETYPVRSRQYRRWLSRLYYEATGGSAPTNDTMQTALGMIEAKAANRGPQA